MLTRDEVLKVSITAVQPSDRWTTISFRIRQNDFAALRRQAAEAETTISGLVRLALGLADSNSEKEAKA